MLWDAGRGAARRASGPLALAGCTEDAGVAPGSPAAAQAKNPRPTAIPINPDLL